MGWNGMGWGLWHEVAKWRVKGEEGTKGREEKGFAVR